MASTASDDERVGSSADWHAYYAKLSGRPPRAHLLRALENLGDSGTAIDLGAGDGVDARYLLGRGWRVVAIDGTPGTRDRVLDGAPPGAGDHLEAHDMSFDEVTSLPRAELIFASYSLPFAGESEFAHIWSLIREALASGGVFAGQLFGPNDDWSRNRMVTAHTAADVTQLLDGWEAIDVDEWESDGDSGAGRKHWHVFDILARRP